MPKAARAEDVPERSSTGYPPPFAALVRGRHRRRLGEHFGLEDFGVNLTRLEPGAATAQRHWHSAEDEFVYVLDGELVLMTEAGEEPIGAGMFVGFRKGVADGHHLVNRSDRTALLLEIGSRHPGTDEVEYPDIDLRCIGGRRFVHRDGTPW